MNVFGQVNQGCLPGSDKIQERNRINRIQQNAITVIDGRAMAFVKGVKNLENLFFPIGGNLFALFHHGPNQWFGQKAKKCLGVDKSSGNPDQLNDPVSESGGKLDADTQLDAHDPAGFQEFCGKLGLNMVVIDDTKPSKSHDPGIHDQMCGGFSSFGVDIVDMVIKGQLIPRLLHFQQMIPPELLTDDTGFAHCRHPKIMGQFQLADGVSLGTDQLLHDL
jgi:hypothetical protein